jgi:hypothetical protein
MGSRLGVATEGLRPTGGTCPPPDLPDPRDAPLERGGLIDMRAGKTLFCTDRRRSETCRGQLSRFSRMLVGLSGCARRGKKSRSDARGRLPTAILRDTTTSWAAFCTAPLHVGGHPTPYEPKVNRTLWVPSKPGAHSTTAVQGENLPRP